MNPYKSFCLQKFFKKKVDPENQKKDNQQKMDDKHLNPQNQTQKNKTQSPAKKRVQKEKIITNQKSLFEYFKPRFKYQQGLRLQQSQKESSICYQDQQVKSNQYADIYDKVQGTIVKQENKVKLKSKKKQKQKPFQTSLLNYINIKNNQEESQNLQPIDINWKKINKQLSQKILIKKQTRARSQSIPKSKSKQKPVKQMIEPLYKPKTVEKIAEPVENQISKNRVKRTQNQINYCEVSQSDQNQSQSSSQTENISYQPIQQTNNQINKQYDLHLIKKSQLPRVRRKRSQSFDNNQIQSVAIQHLNQGYTVHLNYQHMLKHHKLTLKLLFQSYI